MNPTSSKLLETLGSVAHGFFGRQGGVSQGHYASLNCGPGSADDPQSVMENRARVSRWIGATKLNTLYQIHSADAVTVDTAWTRDSAPKADGMATRTKGIALGVLAADCAPVLFADEVGGVIGAAHAGWKGAIGGVVASTITAMESLGTSRENISAAIGPCIAQDAYEVGPEFFDHFALTDPTFQRFFVPAQRSKHWHFDLPGFVSMQLAEAGVRRIDPLDICTYTDEHAYFSYRRTTHAKAPDYGRNLSVIVLK